MAYQEILNNIAAEVRPLLTQGRVASYIPPLAAVSSAQFGMALRTVEGTVFTVGDAHRRFSIQSISKIFSLALAMRLEGETIWERVGREPSGTRFNSLVQLEAEKGVPRNPMINAGALVIVDMILGHQQEGKDLLLGFVRKAAADDTIGYDLEVATAELETAHRNRALAHFLKSFGVLRGNPDRVVKAYCHLCSLSMSCEELCRAATFLATAGRAPGGARVVPPRLVKRLNAVMLTCGVYDEAGDYAYRVGLPAKSGVGGGVVAVMPGTFVVTVWSPGLNEKGNSLAGTMALELLTTRTGISIF